MQQAHQAMWLTVRDGSEDVGRREVGSVAAGQFYSSTGYTTRLTRRVAYLSSLAALEPFRPSVAKSVPPDTRTGGVS